MRSTSGSSLKRRPLGRKISHQSHALTMLAAGHYFNQHQHLCNHSHIHLRPQGMRTIQLRSVRESPAHAGCRSVEVQTAVGPQAQSVRESPAGCRGVEVQSAVYPQARSVRESSVHAASRIADGTTADPEPRSVHESSAHAYRIAEVQTAEFLHQLQGTPLGETLTVGAPLVKEDQESPVKTATYGALLKRGAPAMIQVTFASNLPPKK